MPNYSSDRINCISEQAVKTNALFKLFRMKRAFKVLRLMHKRLVLDLLKDTAFSALLMVISGKISKYTQDSVLASGLVCAVLSFNAVKFVANVIGLINSPPLYESIEAGIEDAARLEKSTSENFDEFKTSNSMQAALENLRFPALKTSEFCDKTIVSVDEFYAALDEIKQECKKYNDADLLEKITIDNYELQALVVTRDPSLIIAKLKK